MSKTWDGRNRFLGWEGEQVSGDVESIVSASNKEDPEGGRKDQVHAAPLGARIAGAFRFLFMFPLRTWI